MTIHTEIITDEVPADGRSSTEDAKMTTELVIKAKLADLVKGMLAKGFRQPRAQYWIKADEQSLLYFSWGSIEKLHNFGVSTSEVFNADDFGAALVMATDWLDRQPTVEQRQFREFAEILGKAIEIGKQNGIDAVLVNPLEKAMRDLSKNALMFRAEAAE